MAKLKITCIQLTPVDPETNAAPVFIVLIVGRDDSDETEDYLTSGFISSDESSFATVQIQTDGQPAQRLGDDFVMTESNSPQPLHQFLHNNPDALEKLYKKRDKFL